MIEVGDEVIVRHRGGRDEGKVLVVDPSADRYVVEFDSGPGETTRTTVSGSSLEVARGIEEEEQQIDKVINGRYRELLAEYLEDRQAPTLWRLREVKRVQLLVAGKGPIDEFEDIRPAIGNDMRAFKAKKEEAEEEEVGHVNIGVSTGRLKEYKEDMEELHRFLKEELPESVVINRCGGTVVEVMKDLVRKLDEQVQRHKNEELVEEYEEQIDKLRSYMLEYWPEEIQEGGAIDNAIALLKKYDIVFKGVTKSWDKILEQIEKLQEEKGSDEDEN